VAGSCASETRTRMISVVIPVFNGAAYIAQAIDSVLAQTMAADEILVVDDGSSDSTREIVRRYKHPVRYLAQSNRGAAAARNLGIRESKGDLLAFLDADDVWLPEKLALQSAALAEDTSVDLIFCQMVQFRSPELPPDRASALFCDEAPHRALLCSCLLARKTAFDRAGLMQEDRKCEFLDWYLRAQETGLRIHFVDSVLVKRRIHAGNYSLTNNRDLHRDYLLTLKMSLDRRNARSRATTGGAS